MNKLLKLLFSKTARKGIGVFLSDLKDKVLNELHRIFSNIAVGLACILIGALLLFTAFLVSFVILATFLIQIGVPVLLAYAINLVTILLAAVILIAVGISRLKRIKPKPKSGKKDKGNEE